MKDASKLTLGEMEALAWRLEKAARTIRESMALIAPQNGGIAPFIAPPSAPIAPQHDFKPSPNNPAILETPERTEYEEAIAQRKRERQAFLQSMKGSPERQAKLAQFRHDGEGGEPAIVTTEKLEHISGD